MEGEYSSYEKILEKNPWKAFRPRKHRKPNSAFKKPVIAVRVQQKELKKDVTHHAYDRFIERTGRWLTPEVVHRINSDIANNVGFFIKKDKHRNTEEWEVLVHDRSMTVIINSSNRKIVTVYPCS